MSMCACALWRDWLVYHPYLHLNVYGLCCAYIYIYCLHWFGNHPFRRVWYVWCKAGRGWMRLQVGSGTVLWLRQRSFFWGGVGFLQISHDKICEIKVRVVTCHGFHLLFLTMSMLIWSTIIYAFPFSFSPRRNVWPSDPKFSTPCLFMTVIPVPDVSVQNLSKHVKQILDVETLVVIVIVIVIDCPFGVARHKDRVEHTMGYAYGNLSCHLRD